MYSLSFGKVNQADTPGLLALVALAILLPGSALGAKPETGNGCCPGYMKKEMNAKFFNRFQRSYQDVTVCGSQQAAVMFKLKDGTSMCVDPRRDWVKLLMKRIDKATRSQRKPAVKNQPQRQTGASGTRATKPPTSGSPTSRPATSTGQEVSSNPADSTEGHSETSAHPQQGEGSSALTSENQIGTRPAMPVGDANTSSSTRALGTLPFTPTTAVIQETTWRTTTSIEPRGSGHTSRKSHQGEGDGLQASEGQTGTNPPIPWGASTASSASRPGAAGPAQTAAVLRETPPGTVTSTAPPGGGGPEKEVPETQASSPSPGEAQSGGARADGPASWSGRGGELVKTDRREGTEPTMKRLPKSHLAVSVLLLLTFLLVSVSTYLYCKKRGGQGQRYHSASVECTEDVCNAL
ncbi:probable GPI-anchored adhesin-like protein PGA18 isoform X1 [Carcharodon carcharias]|uniref:probable GPI-anchored adhesin-like protein PGA18 isoform X1 n=1 Tax=Carcharodon carcharias TaxID=13397 RepID=UPI001B7E092A|nr:probable GPI-anchored adhesin-like protein PGA18 isoform X1 [Carcharodon carcharias]